MVLPPTVPYRVSWRSLDASMVLLDASLVDDVAAQADPTGQGPGHVEFSFDSAVSPVAALQWNQVVTLVQRVAVANAGHPDGALLADSLNRLLSATALTCFRNTSLRADDVPVGGCPPASLRRAVAFIDSHLDRPVTLGEIAAAARVTPRALQPTFRRHLGTTPMGYLRRARLAAAHHDLRNAEPGDGQTVTAIAARWGFPSLPRFGVAYRQAYGQPPSVTLRKD
ncbi:AraC-like DNA-binding protein [Friedmanniella endophytica]|uniref:AraC-like DNA-binding protein n=1 Tax=Microlunatus kandeliicorticis TaxID=1759536 RepID=A0A7W3IVU1_9ACTN|nr:AraC family transcriptional regulator [Microlunatus kandeliicorticis]MBA8796134.1 AraC-like DNA-binding protein [Microlunatus kandeliicorticis]